MAGVCKKYTKNLVSALVNSKTINLVQITNLSNDAISRLKLRI